jgi:hypothetical protein
VSGHVTSTHSVLRRSLVLFSFVLLVPKVCLVRWQYVWMFRAWEKWLDTDLRDDEAVVPGKGFLGGLLAQRGMGTVSEEQGEQGGHGRSESTVDDGEVGVRGQGPFWP